MKRLLLLLSLLIYFQGKSFSQSCVDSSRRFLLRSGNLKLYLLLFIVFTSHLLNAQQTAFCTTKSSRNFYVAADDTSLALHKTIAQISNSKILLFKVRSSSNSKAVPTIAKVEIDGKIEWSRGILIENSIYTITEFDALAVKNNNTFIFFIAETNDGSGRWVCGMLWFDDNGNIIRQNSYNLKDNPVPGILKVSSIRLNMSPSGNILFMLNLFQPNSAPGSVLIGNINATGSMAWSKVLKNSETYYSSVDLISFKNSIVIQGLTEKTSFPWGNVVISTKLNLSDGEIISTTSKREQTHLRTGPLASSVSVLTDDYKIKTLISWRIPFHYQIYFSFTQDTLLNMLKSTTFYTSTDPKSYLPSSAALNSKGFSIIKSYGGTDSKNTGFFIADTDDIVVQQKTIGNFPYFTNYKNGNADVIFDNADSVYIYWSGQKEGKDIVGWIKSYIQNTTDFCSVRDSSFIESADYPMFDYDLKVTKIAENVLEPFSLEATLSAPSIKHIIDCEKITGFCNPIKIKPVDTICSITQPVKLTVHKNAECEGKILFNFDTAAVKNWQQPDDTTLLLQFEKSWNGKVFAKASSCEYAKDSIHLVIDAPLQGINLGEDTILCDGDMLRLFVPTGFQSYLWQNQTTKIFFDVTKGGEYFITVKDNCSRSYSDTIKIIFINKKINLGPDSTICKKESIQLSVRENFMSYSWTPAYNISSTNSKSVTVNPERTTTYSVLAKTAEGCSIKDTIIIFVKDCPQQFFIPTAFTPNNDTRNDLFKPIFTAPIEKYTFSIYNRWDSGYFTVPINQKDGMENCPAPFRMHVFLHGPVRINFTISRQFLKKELFS